MRNTSFTVLILLVCLGCQPDADLLESVLEQPSKVNLIFPENNSLCTTGTVISEELSEIIFEWTAAEFGDTYTLQVRNLETGNLTEYETTEPSMAVILERSMPYQWVVITGITSSSEETLSDRFAFYNAGLGIENHIPFPATATFPRNGELIRSSSAQTRLQWEGSDLDNDILFYEIFLGTDENPSLYADTTTMALENVQVTQGVRYYWKITTHDTQGNTSTSDLYTFMVE